MTDFFSDKSYFEVLIYGVIITVLVIGLFVLNRILRVAVGDKVKRTELPFGMSPHDFEKLKSAGGVTDEEMKKIRQAMGRRFIERAKAEEEKKKLPRKAELALQIQDPKPASNAPSPPPPSEPPPQVAVPSGPTLPEHLVGLVQRSDLELEEMRLAGFLSDQDIALIRLKRPPS